MDRYHYRFKKMNIQDFADNIVQNDGLWVSLENRKISYPEEGNKLFMEIEEQSFWFKHRKNCITTMVKKYSPNDIFFDIGGGNGFVAKGLEEHHIQTVLVEPSIQGALNAQKRGLQQVVCATLEDAGFRKNALKAVGLFDVVEHIENDTAFLNAIHSFLATEGVVYITVPAYSFLWSNEDVDAGHFRRYTLKNISELLVKTGFKIEFSSYIFSALPIPILLARTLPSILGLHKNTTDANTHKKAHAPQKGFIQKWLEKIWEVERSRIQQGKKIPFGSSCFVVARKKSL